MGSSVNFNTKNGIEEVASSIFRADPKEELSCPWDAVFVFCETSLHSHYGRIFPPFLRFVSGTERDKDIFFPLRNFNYEQMEWRKAIPTLSKPEKRGY